MKKLLLGLLLFSGAIFAQTRITPDCTIPFTFTTTGSTSNLTCGNNTQGIANWIMVYSSTGYSALSIVVQSAPDNAGAPGSWATFAGTVLTTTQYPGSSGANPNTAITSANVGLAGYFPWNRVTLSSVTGTGKVTGTMYGFLNSTLAKNGSGGGGGGPTILGTANQITVTGAGCTTGSTSTCTIALANNTVLPGNPSTPGTFSTGTGGGTTGAIDLTGKTSAATSTLTVDDNNTATTVKLPNDATSGLYLVTSPSATPTSGRCAQFNGTGTQIAPAAAACGSGGGGVNVQVNGSAIGAATTINFAAGTNVTQSGSGSGTVTVTTNSTGGATGGATNGYSAPAVTLPTAGTTFIPPVGGGLPSSTEANVQWIAPVTATLSDMTVVLSSAIGLGNSIAFTFRDGGSSQTVTCTISGSSAKTCTDLTHSFSVTQGDLLDIQIVTTGTVVAAPNVQIGYEYGGGGGGGGGGSVTSGAFSALPGTCTTGALYFFTSGGYNSALCTSTNTWTIYVDGTTIVLPSTISFSWLNQGASTVSYTQGFGVMSPENGDFSARVQHLAIPAFTTNATLDVVLLSPIYNNDCFTGLVVDDGTKLVTTDSISPGTGGTTISNWSSPTSISSNAYSQPQTPIGPHWWNRVVVDASNLTFFLSVDGQNWGQVFQMSITSNLSAATNWGWYTTCPTNHGGPFSLLTFKQVIN